MEKIRLEEYCIKKINNVPKQGEFDIDYIDISSIDGASKRITGYNTYKISEAPSRAKQLLEEGDVLVSTVRPNLNAVALCDIEVDNTLVGSTGFCVLRGNNKVNNKYIYYFCQSKYFVGELMKVATGASYPAVKKSDVTNVMIPKRKLDEQNEIVETLEALKGIINHRKEQLELFDNLIKSRFVKMFGDPVINDMNWTLSKLGEVCTKITDGTHDTPQRFSEGVLLITGKNIRKDRIDLSNVEYVSKEDHEVIYARCNPEYGDVLYTNIGVNYGTAILNTLNFEFSMKNVALLKPEKHVIDGHYLWHVMNLLRDKILDQNKSGGAQTFMGLAKIKEISIPIPDLELQLQFTIFIKHIEELKMKVKESLRESQLLFDSMMQEYFD